MMLVRRAQLDAFRAAAEESFVEEMVRYMRRFSPPLHRTLGDEKLERIVRSGITRATGYGFSRRGPIRLFLEMTWLFGSGFDTDPQIPWAKEVLTDPRYTDEMFRAGRLEALARQFLDEVHGKDDEHAGAALRRIESDAPGWVFGGQTWRQDVEAALARTFPQKHARLGPDCIMKLQDRAEAEATQVFGPDEVRGKGVLAILMFSFGAGCLVDPLYPWIGETASSAKLGDPRRRAEALERKSLWWVKAVNTHRLAEAS